MIFGKIKRTVAGPAGETGKEAGLAPDQRPVPETSAKTRAEAIVQQAPDVIPHLQQVTEQKEADARTTIEMLEKARADKGNFCVTLGTGEKRAVILVTPLEGRTVQKKDQHLDTDYDCKDYYLITPHGPRRISLVSEFRSGVEQVAKDDKKYLAGLELALENAVKGNGVIEAAEFNDYGVSSTGTHEMSLKMPVPTMFGGKEKEKIYISSNYRDDQYKKDEYRIAPVREEAVIEQAVKASLEQTQSPIQIQIANARGEIAAMQGVRKGLS